MPIDLVALVVLGLFLAVVALGSVGLSLPLGRPILAVFLLSFVLGALVLTLFGFGPRPELSWLLYALGTSLIVVLAVGLEINLQFPPGGPTRPLRPVPLIVTYTLLIGWLALAVRVVGRPKWNLALPRRIELSPAPLSLSLLPPMSVFAVVLLNGTGVNVPLLFVLGLIALVPLAVVRGWVPVRWQPLAIWSVAISLLYHKTFWRFDTFSGQGNIIDAWKLGHWTPWTEVEGATSTSLVPNAVFSSTYAHVGGIDIFTQLNVVNPLVVSLIPLIVFVTFRQYVDSRDAFLGACVFAFAHPFYFQLPNGGRAATPVLFLAFLTLVLSDSRLAPLPKRSLGLAFTAGLVVSHYGAAYLLMLSVAVAVPLRVLLDYAVTPLRPALQQLASDGGRSPVEAASNRSRVPLLTPVYVALYAVMAMGWYMYTDSGQKFKILPEHVLKMYNEVVLGIGSGSGGTANRLARNYGAMSIQLSKLLYVLLGALMLVGLFVAYRRRFFAPDRNTFSDEFLTLSTALLGAFGLSFFLSGSWGGGRPMALAFCVTGVFAVVGARAFARTGVRFLRSLDSSSVPPAVLDRVRDPPAHLGRTAVAVLLALLLVLNTGVAAAVVLGGTAPSSVPLQQQIATSDNPEQRANLYKSQDVEMYVWLVDHRDPSLAIYGDWITINQYNDWYRPRISAAVDRSRPYTPLTYNYLLPGLAEPGDHPGYVMLGGHNVALGVSAGSDDDVPLDDVRPALSRRDKIYTSGFDQIYIKNDTK